MRIVSLLFHDVYVSEPGESGFVSPAADRYKLSVPAFEAQLDGVARVRANAPILATDLGPTSVDEPFPFLITVDDGGLSYFSVVADRLEARGWRGHCFVTTDFIGRPGFLTASQIRELDARGHVMGSHSASHPARFSTCTADQMRQEWSSSKAVLEDLLGHAVIAGSVPGGYFSLTVAEMAAESGLSWLFNSEPTTRVCREEQSAVAGRFTIRHRSSDDLSRRLVMPQPAARYGAWASWHAKGLVKPLLGPCYSRVADWLSPRTAAS
jgi:peptidoglycan/xylan/chitin deacetylase (PgdA/CDA1 family)